MIRSADDGWIIGPTTQPGSWAGSRAGSARARGKLLDKAVGDRLVHHETLGGHADLALVEEGAEHCGIDRTVDIRIVEHHEWRLAAELQQAALEVPGAFLGDHPAHLGRAGEVHAAYRLVRDQRIGNFGRMLGRGGEEVEHALRQPRLVERLGQQRMRGRALLGPFQDHRVAEGQRIGDGARAEDHRAVPGHDAEHGTDRLAQGHGQRAGSVGRNRLALGLGGEAGGLADQRDRGGHVETGPQRRGADFLCHDPAQFVGLRLERIGGGEQQPAALARSDLRPRGEGPGAGVGRPDRILGRGGAGGGDHLLGQRIEALVRLAGGAGLLAVVDDEFNVHKSWLTFQCGNEAEMRIRLQRCAGSA
nr:hypothetical protein [Xanthomonas euroxanthea]